MSLLSLPTELVLSIVEQAAWDEVNSHPEWVAGLCLVSSAFRSAATGPLYHTVAIDQTNFDSAVWTASLSDTPFLRTRRVTMSVYPASMAHISEGHFSRAFANVEYFAAPVQTFRALAEHGQQLRCVMVYMTAEVTDDAECELLRPLLEQCTHLHILLSMEYWDSDVEYECWRLPDVRLLLGPRTTRLVVDPMVPEDLPTERIEQMVEMLLDLPCDRVIFRTLEIGDEAAIQGFCTLVGSMTRDRRNERVWIDDTPRDPEKSIFDHGCDESRRGWALWSAGRPLYVP